MEGFIVFDYAKQYAQARKELAQWLSEGKIQRKETIIKGGLAKAEQALVDLYNGFNTGQSLLLLYLFYHLNRFGHWCANGSTGKLLVEVYPADGVQTRANM